MLELICHMYLKLSLKYYKQKGPAEFPLLFFPQFMAAGLFLFKAILNTFNYILERKRFFIGPVLTLYFSGTFSRAYRNVLIPLRIVSTDIYTNPRFTFQ